MQNNTSYKQKGFLKRIRFSVFILSIAGGSLFTQVAYAAQIIEVVDDIEIKATISSYELNRVKIEGGRIEGFRALEGDLVAVPDAKKGELFIHLPRKYSRKVTNLFLTSDSGATFKLLLVPRNIPAEQIFLVERATRDKKLEIGNDYRSKILSFYKGLYNRSPIPDYKISYKKKKSKINNLRVTKVATYTAADKAGFVGEIFEIKNRSKEVKIISPQDFYKDGARAIKLNSHILEKGQTTEMYIISING